MTYKITEAIMKPILALLAAGGAGIDEGGGYYGNLVLLPFVLLRVTV